MQHRWWKYLLHVAICLVLLALPYLFTRGDLLTLPDWHGPRERMDFGIYVLLVGFFYLNYYILVPKLYLTKKYLFYAVVVGCFFLLPLLLPNILHGEQTRPTNIAPTDRLDLESQQHPPRNVPMERMAILFLVGFSASFFLRMQRHLQQVEKEKFYVELSYLKAQIHPHFLFNTLNSIYALVIRGDEKAADSIVMLSEFLRYVIRDAGSHEVALEKELDFIDNYIRLQQSRLGHTVQIDYQLTGRPAGKRIAPLILFSLVENAFKHGVNPDENSHIQLHIELQERGLTLFITNHKVKTQYERSEGGIGMANARDRLALLYPDQYKLTVEETHHDFNVTLSIDLL